jgi:murein L,D-transpeptidase YcbB/YkuD
VIERLHPPAGQPAYAHRRALAALAGAVLWVCPASAEMRVPGQPLQLQSEVARGADFTPAPVAPALVPQAPVTQAPVPAAPAHAAPAQPAPAPPAAQQGPAPAQAATPDQATIPLPRPVPGRARIAAQPEARISQDPQPTLHQASASMILRAASDYAAVAARGGWPAVPESPPVKPGETSPVVPFVRARLAAEGMDAGAGHGETLDAQLAAAVKLFQLRHGLPETGIVGPATVKAKNVSAVERQRQLLYTAQRLAGSSFGFGPRHVVVNIPSAAVEAIENGSVTRRYVAVVGDKDHPSPQVEARVGAINFHPTWTVPVSIIKNEIIPKMRKDPGYLAKSKIRIFGASGREFDPATIDWSGDNAVNYTLRQDSGAANSLGVVRIAMPNKHAVYMHDTPSKRFFGRDFRFLSHGCVRVSGVADLVAWILGPQGWTKESVEAAMAADDRKDVRVSQPVPVAWVYLTGFVTPDGTVHFREDVYGLDKPAPGEPVATASIKRT